MRAIVLRLAATALLFADGGIVLLHRNAPPYVVTVFASPNPPRAGMIDMSVLVRSGDTLDPVLGRIECVHHMAPPEAAPRVLLRPPWLRESGA